MLTSFLNPALALNELGSVNFSVLALDVDDASRCLLENALVERLRENDYQVIQSYPVIEKVSEIDTRTVRTVLTDAGYDAVLIIRPVDIGR